MYTPYKKTNILLFLRNMLYYEYEQKIIAKNKSFNVYDKIPRIGFF